MTSHKSDKDILDICETYDKRLQMAVGYGSVYLSDHTANRVKRITQLNKRFTRKLLGREL